MDGENNGKPYFLMDDLGVPLFLETRIYFRKFAKKNQWQVNLNLVEHESIKIQLKVSELNV